MAFSSMMAVAVGPVTPALVSAACRSASDTNGTPLVSETCAWSLTLAGTSGLFAMPVKNDADAITLMNDSPYGLTASIWTDDLDAAARIGAQVETGTVFANRCDYLDPALVWTGVKDTGKGGALSEIGYANLSQPKSYHLKSV